MLNSVLHNVGLSWIISSNKKVEYDTEENNPDWLNKVPCYNTVVCSKLHGTFFEYFIINARIYRYNLICSITAHDKQQPTYIDGASSGVSTAIPKNSTTSVLKSLVATLNFIGCWLKHFQHNYKVRLIMYH